MDKLKIIFEDRSVLVIDKPAGLVVNKSETIREETLQDQLAKYFKLESGNLGIGERAGIVHRLDRETSGILVVAKNQKTFENLQAQFKMRLVKKEYTALVHNANILKEGSIESYIGRVGRFGKFGIVGRSFPDARISLTSYRTEGQFKLKNKIFDKFSKGLKGKKLAFLKNHAATYALLSVFPKTGRTHQIRIHLKSIGHPVVSDLIYEPRKLIKLDLTWCPRLFLHAKSIELEISHKKVVFESPLPYDLIKAKENLEVLPNGV